MLNIDHVTADICSIVNVSYQTVRLELLSEYLGSNEGKEKFHELLGSFVMQMSSTSCNGYNRQCLV